MTTTRTTAIGIFETFASARGAVEDLRRLGVPDERIGLATRFEEQQEHQKWPVSPEVERAGPTSSGAGIGMLTGGALGGFLAGATALPILAPILAGALVGGLVGFFIGLGVPEDEANYYEKELREGRTIVTVNEPGRYEEAREVLRRHGGRETQSPVSRSGVGRLP